MDAVQQILNRLDSLDMSINQFGKIARVSSGEITSRLNGRKPLNGDLAIRLLRLTDALIELKTSIDAPLGWGNTQEILALLKRREESRRSAGYDQKAHPPHGGRIPAHKDVNEGQGSNKKRGHFY